jgi:small-conductance mechanosensitive channel
MTPAVAQAATAAASQPRDVREGFSLVWQKVDSWIDAFISLIPNLVVGLAVALIFVAAGWMMGLALKHAVRRAGRRDLAHLLSRFAFWLTVFVGALVVMAIVLPSMRPVDVVTSLGFGSVAIGFAMKDILQNWIAGFFILVRRPFHRGDQIKVKDIEGTVLAVETRATLVKTYSGRLVMVPNIEIYTQAVTVHTAYDHRRMEITVPVGLEVDLDEFGTVVREVLANNPDILQDPCPDVLPWDFKDNNVDVKVRWWTKSQRTFEVRTRAAVVRAIKSACEEAGIPLPADTKISFAETPLKLARETPDDAAARVRPTTPKHKPTSIVPEPEPEPDEHHDPEAEKPKPGKLTEGAEKVPR